jgi:hypothetical protein
MRITGTAVLLALLAVYLVKLGLPAPAYIAGACIIIGLLSNPFTLRFTTEFLLLATCLGGFIVYLAARGGASDALGVAFLLNLTISLVVAAFMETRFNVGNIRPIAIRVFWFVILVATFDTVWKFLNPKEFDELAMADRDFFEFGFYQFKGSFFYLDSNALAFLLLPFLAMSAQLAKGAASKLTKVMYWSPILLIVLSLSRAALVSTLLFVFLSRIPRKLAITACVAGGILGSSYIGFLSSDASGSYKLYELRTLYNFWEGATFYDRIFGIGFGQGDQLAGIFLQNFIVKMTIELGAAGLITYLLFVVALGARTGQWWLLLAISIFSMSSNFYFFPPFCMAAIYLTAFLSKRPTVAGKKSPHFGKSIIHRDII